MRRISQTILKDYESNTDAHTDENLFEQLSIMIADIVGACLTNLPLVIARKCYGSPIEEREKSVRHAASLLGETEEIMEILRSHPLPSLSGDLAAYIDEWRAFMKQKNTPTIVVSSNNETVASGSGELHLDVDVHLYLGLYESGFCFWGLWLGGVRVSAPSAATNAWLSGMLLKLHMLWIMLVCCCCYKANASLLSGCSIMA
ncbi:hypothetical protein Vadar_034175 [Vaccinium darrowii]|uniref:Uncharacterized protein n=1 Tax=Vaccinium darrowii TaxID=229202 RepID=A0ACB7ZPR2_9ERIC|nr:hypothetical protein Vadar_034175 [Vaccinium darrowii]